MHTLNIVYVALGSALGGVCRYLVSLAFMSVNGFPWGTLFVNVIGSLVIGVLTGGLSRFGGWGTELRLFAIVGFCGGFTTFSTLSNETFKMLENGAYLMAAIYVTVSLLFGLVAVWLGYYLSS